MKNSLSKLDVAIVCVSPRFAAELARRIPAEVPAGVEVLIGVSDPRYDTAGSTWVDFYAKAFRRTRNAHRQIICETDGGGGPVSNVNTLAAVIFEYLRSVPQPQQAFLEALFTLAEYGAASTPAAIVDAARTAVTLESVRQRIERPPAAAPAPTARSEVAEKPGIEPALAGAEAELAAARQCALALTRVVPPRKSSAGDFDEPLYLALYPDVVEGVRNGTYKNAQDHWLRTGAAAGHIAPQRHAGPNIPPYFDDAAYLAQHPDAAAAVDSGEFSSSFEHWTKVGLYRGYEFPVAMGERHFDTFEPGYDEDLYLFFNPDVAAGVRKGLFPNGYEHWKHHGDFEGRAGGPLDLVEDRREFRHVFASRAYGVNAYGFFSTASGLGTHGRGALQALEARGIPVQPVNVPPWSDTSAERRNPIVNPYRINLLIQNADMMGRFLRHYGKELLNGCYNIGYWAWELPSTRMDWFDAYRYVDEVWVASEYVRHSFQTLTRVPVVRIPLVVDGLDEKAIYGRDHFELPEGVFVFCYIFDVSSQLERKNPACLVEAFKREFGNSRDVLLFLKSSNRGYDSSQAKALAKLAQAPNIRVFDGVLSEAEIISLHNAIDCFVSPHRAEGFGLNIAEAMYFGKPVIATRYSANVDFMNDANGYLIDYRLVPIQENAGPYRKGFVWADPSIEHLQLLMRRVFENPAERTERGRNAREEIRTHYSANAVGSIIEQRFRAIGVRDPAPPPDLFCPHLFEAWPRFTPPGVPQPIRRQIREFDFKPVVSIVTPVYNVEPEYLRKCIDSVRNQWYPNWELCLCDDASTREDTRAVLAEYQGSDPRIKIVWSDRNLGIAGASNRAAEISSGEYIALLDNDDELTRDALFQVVEALNQDRDIDFLYTDEDKIDYDGSYGDHYFKPDWSPEHLQSVMYLLHLLVFRKDLFYNVGGFRTEYSGAQDYDLALRLTARARKIHHIAKILYHWRKLAGSAAAAVDAKPAALDAGHRALADFIKAHGIDAEVLPGLIQGTFRVKRRIAGNPRVTLCILTNDRSADVPRRGRINLVSHFVRSIVEKTDYSNYEILIVDDGNLSAATRQALEGIDYRVASFTAPNVPFNFSKKVNWTVKQVNTEDFLLLNDDLEVITPGWLSALLEFTRQKEIGCAGSRLIFPDERVQHAGIVIGVNGSTSHAFYSDPRDQIGYNGFTHIVRNYAAVTGACLATRKSVFEQAGGFDERFATDFNDVDFCLSVLERGYRIVYTPYSELYHFENCSIQRREPSPAEVERFARRWAKYMNHDPYYNPNLTHHSCDFSGAWVESDALLPC